MFKFNKLFAQKVLLFLTFGAAFAAIILNIYDAFTAPYGNPRLNLVNNFSYFTTQSNVLVAISAWYFLFRKPKFTKRELLVQLGTLINIFITCVVYQLLIAPNRGELPSFTLILSNLTHIVSPALYTTYWLWAEKRYKLNYGYAIAWLIYPAIYLAYIVTRGNFVKWYPYPFLDAGNIALGQLVLNVIIFGLIFVSVGLLAVFLNNWLKKRASN